MWQALLFINGYLRMDIHHSKILPTKSRAQHRRPATTGSPSHAEAGNLAMGPKRNFDGNWI